MENINSWEDIQWRSVESRIFRLQLRIFKAAANQEFEKMYKLQKLLITSKTAKFLAVRKVTQENVDKNRLEIDNKVAIPSKERFTLANQISLDGKSFPFKWTYIPKPGSGMQLRVISTIEDRTKQMLAYLALNPQWEATFEASSYGFRPGRSVLDALEAIFLGISKKPKWVLDVDISKCSGRINYQYLIKKCETFPKMQKQISAWLKAGILETYQYLSPETEMPQEEVILPLLVNILLHGIQNEMDKYISTLRGHRLSNKQALTYVRYGNDFIILHPDKDILLALKNVIEQFLKPIGLKLHSTKTRIAHTVESHTTILPGFTFLGFHIIQKVKWVKRRKDCTKRESKEALVTLITPSKKEIKRHKQKLHETIRKYKGASQERLIQKLNPIIRNWAISKRTHVSSRIFQNLDQYVFIHLWKWARKRHPKMSKYKLKQKYWHSDGNKNWIFSIKIRNEIVTKLQLHSKIPIQQYVSVKANASPFDGDFIYWTKRSKQKNDSPRLSIKQNKNGYKNNSLAIESN